MHVETPEDSTVDEIYWLGSDGDEHSDASGAGPALYEWTTYEVFVESKDGYNVQLHHRDPRLVANIASPLHHPELAGGRLSFRGQIGLTRLEVRSGTKSVLGVELEVFPTKLDYDSDYTALLAEVNSAMRALALEYLRATYQGASQERASRPRNVEFATLLRHHADELERAMQWVSSHPTRQLLRVPESARIELIRRPTHLTKKAIRQGRGQGALVQVPGIGSVRRRVPAVRVTETLETPEHRWLRTAITRVKRRVRRLLDEVDGELTRTKARGRATARLEAEREELAGLDARLGRMLVVEPLSEALGSVPQGFSSLRLLRTPGYREAVRALLALNLGLALGGGAVETSVKDLEVLYEFWCFLRLAGSLYEIVGGEADFSQLFRQTDSGLRTSLAPGSEVEVSMRHGWTLRLAYNRSFRGLTGTQRPDILLTVESEGWPSIFIVIDAKYRVQADPDYLKQFRLPGPPEDAINQLHRYRDAIVLSYTDPSRRRPVARGAALFPLDAKTSAKWNETPLREALTAYGIGALPFLPQNEQAVKTWLTEVLAEPTSELAISGPAFAAAAEAGRLRRLSERMVLLIEASAADVALSGAGKVRVSTLLPPATKIDAVALLTTEPTGDSTLRIVADVLAVDLSSGTPVLMVAGQTKLERPLVGSIGPLLPAVTSALALERARAADELGLGSLAQWDLVELLKRRGLSYKASAAPESAGQLRTVVAVGAASVEWKEPDGFLIQKSGGPVEARQALDALEVLAGA
jgi:Domain of unknown function (DUF2357)/PD-(D/E)XK nuclease superfamily